MTTSLADLRARLPELTQRDQQRLRRRADQAAALRDEGAREKAFASLLAELERAARDPAHVGIMSYGRSGDRPLDDPAHHGRCWAPVRIDAASTGPTRRW